VKTFLNDFSVIAFSNNYAGFLNTLFQHGLRKSCRKSTEDISRAKMNPLGSSGSGCFHCIKVKARQGNSCLFPERTVF
jgi:hypothetical protein